MLTPLSLPLFSFSFYLFFSSFYEHTSATTTLFCKCACLTNSTLIPIPSCTECNRQFCRKQRLPICKDVADGDVFTTCFQRDSAKDRAVVWLFVVVTVALLAYAVVRPWIVRYRARGAGAGTGAGYTPLPTSSRS